MKRKITKADIIAVLVSSRSMREAAAKLPYNPKTFRTHAIKHGLYVPNQAGKGISKRHPRFALTDILANKHPGYHTYRIKYRLVEELNWEWKCHKCSITEWMGQQCPLELDHIDGDNKNNNLLNLRFVCPNCHAQTATYRNKKR